MHRGVEKKGLGTENSKRFPTVDHATRSQHLFLRQGPEPVLIPNAGMDLDAEPALVKKLEVVLIRVKIALRQS